MSRASGPSGSNRPPVGGPAGLFVATVELAQQPLDVGQLIEVLDAIRLATGGDFAASVDAAQRPLGVAGALRREATPDGPECSDNRHG